MRDIDKKAIEIFLHGQVECWNSGDRAGFFEHYRTVAANGLSIEYVGRLVMDGFPILENIWNQQNSKFAVKVEVIIIAGNEAACHQKK